MANICLQRVVAICTTSTAAQSFLILLQMTYVSVRNLCQLIFAHFLLPLRSLMHMRRSKLSLKIYPASIAAVPISTETPVDHADSRSSLDSAHAAESSLLPSFRLEVQRHLTELTGPIRTRSAPTTISLSLTKNTATQKGCKQLKCRSTVIGSSCSSDSKKDDRVLVDPDVSTTHTSHHISRSSSFSVNFKSQLNDPRTKQGNRNSFTFMNVMQTKGNDIKSNSCSNLGTKEHAVIGGSSLLLVLSTLTLGRFSAILFTSMSWMAILYIKAYLERGSWSKGLSRLSSSSQSFSQELNKSSTSATYQMDFTSSKYKKRVIMEGLLERNHGIS